MPDITNALLAEKVNTLLTAWRNRELELQAWQSGTAVGGPYLNGTYPITNYVGTVGYYLSPAALVSSVNSPKVAAEAARDAAIAARDLALTYQTGAQAARDLALTYQTGAQAARDLALSYKNFAASHEANAQTSATASAASATSASGSATAANASATAAASSASAASGSATAASGSASAAAASAAAAATFDPANYLLKTGGTLTGVAVFDYGSSSGGTALQLKSSGTNKPAIFWNDGTSNIGGIRFNGTQMELGTGFFTARMKLLTTGAVQIPGYLEVNQGWIEVTGPAYAGFALMDTTAPTDAKWWALEHKVGTLSVTYANEAWSADKHAMEFVRSGYTLTGINYGNATDNPAHTFHGPVATTKAVSNNNDLNADGNNFTVETTTKTTDAYAYAVKRGGVVVGGIRVSGNHIGPVGAFSSWVSTPYIYNADGSKLAVTMDDTYLRLNQSSHFTSGVYTPGAFRADGNVSFGSGGGLAHSLNANGSSIQRYETDDTPVAMHEFYQAFGTVVRPIYVRFHQGSRWYNRLKAENGLLTYVGGADDTPNAMGASVFYEGGTALSSKYEPLFNSSTLPAALNHLWNNADGTHGDVADFNAVTHFGPKYLQATTNGPGTPNATQYYSWSMGLGSNYAYSLYVAQFAIPRAPLGGYPVMSVRFRENGTWGSWSGIRAGALQDGNNQFSPNGASWRIQTVYGYGDFGPQNAGYFHMNCSTTYGFYFGNNVDFGGTLNKYQQGSILYHNTAGRNGSVGRGTAAPTGGSDGDIYFQYT